ncbi:MAG: hypothetical protein J6V63_01090 [Spirochaetaceae bacterium]|nr:hypothetical protein [Spirochaetaceae bacterium]
MKAIILSLLTLLCVSLFPCQKPMELSLSEIQRLTASAAIIEMTIDHLAICPC